MATRQAPQKPPKRPTWIGWALSLPIRIAVVVVISVLTSIVIEWVGIYLDWWPQAGGAHARDMLTHELGWIDTEFTRSLVFAEPVAMAKTVITSVYDTVFASTGIAGWFEANAGSPGLAGTIAVYGTAAVDVSLVVLVRVYILALTLPLFMLTAFVAIVDGLVRRDLRRFGAGHESAFIYHHAKRVVGPIFIIGWLLYLSVPFSFHPNLFLVPCALLFGFVLSITVGSFKKYL